MISIWKQDVISANFYENNYLCLQEINDIITKTIIMSTISLKDINNNSINKLANMEFKNFSGFRPQSENQRQ